MRLFSKQFGCLFCGALAALCLTGCGRQAEVPTVPDEIITLPTAPREETVPETTSSLEQVEHLEVVMEAGQIYTLDHYPNLRSVDLSGSTCYETILEYIAEHPQVDVTYTVSFGAGTISNKVTSATLLPEGLDYDLLLENLRYLPDLTSLSLPDIQLTPEQVETLAAAYPDLALDFSVDLFGNTVSSSTTYLDLSYMDSSQVDEACGKLGLLPNLEQVQLSGSLSMTDVAKLQDSNPSAAFLYTFSLFGKTLSTTDENVEFVNHTIGNDGQDRIRQALDILDNCERFVLDNCQVDFDILAQIREEYRGRTKVVWRVYFGKDYRYNTLTDAETIRAVYNVTNDTVSGLQYCEGARFIDMGHNDYLTDLSFVGSMPELEVFIGSGCAVKSLDGFENCKKLTWLELANCLKLTDISALAGCESLTYLNLSSTRVTDLMPLDSLPLKRFVCLRPHVPAAEQKTFQEIHEDCLTVFYGYSNPYGYGWRYDDNGKTFNEYYKNVVREAFNYDYLETLLPKDNKK